jgi:hypothetical protein
VLFAAAQEALSMAKAAREPYLTAPAVAEVMAETLDRSPATLSQQRSWVDT